MNAKKSQFLGFLRRKINSEFLTKKKDWQKEDLVNRIKTKPELKDFYGKNREEVLTLYRHMLKTIPSMEKNLFRRVCLKERIKFNFREGSIENDVSTIMSLKNNCYIIIEKINTGIYPPFPHYKAF
mmetsp:Transcript_22414/g.23345  ORF Transcript_22414/g.23345 Transcript_22414/m.23345 type:complete len:126 (-) Transcript_22414:39-416(-)